VIAIFWLDNRFDSIQVIRQKNFNNKTYMPGELLGQNAWQHYLVD